MRLPGTRLLFEGFHKVRFQLNDTVGRSVMYARGGKMLGGNSAFAHIGTYEKIGDEIAIEIKTVRHNPDPNYRAMAGTDNATLPDLQHGDVCEIVQKDIGVLRNPVVRAGA